MDGLLVVNKPAGLTSHDVVARARRVLRERRIGHTGTLDAMATGVLPLVLGRATRLARFLTACDKTYEATLRLGFATDTNDATGRAVGKRFEGTMPAREAIDEALDAFRGSFLQQPPAYSAKKIGGIRSYKLARDAAQASAATNVDVLSAVDVVSAPPTLPAPVTVTAHAIAVMTCANDIVTLAVHCSAGFYIRSLAHDLGERLGVGAHLTALCRTSSGEMTLEHAVSLSALEDVAAGAAIARDALVPLAHMLPSFPGCTLTVEGVRRAVHGQDLGPADFSDNVAAAAASSWLGAMTQVRLVGPDGALVGIGEASAKPGLLHPAVILV